jgi:hypothetical protein
MLRNVHNLGTNRSEQEKSCQTVVLPLQVSVSSSSWPIRLKRAFKTSMVQSPDDGYGLEPFRSTDAKRLIFVPQ